MMLRSHSWPKLQLKPGERRKRNTRAKVDQLKPKLNAKPKSMCENNQKQRELITGRKECVQCASTEYRNCSKGFCSCVCHSDLRVYKNDVITLNPNQHQEHVTTDLEAKSNNIHVNICPSNLRVVEHLGCGNFGQVYKCRLELKRKGKLEISDEQNNKDSDFFQELDSGSTENTEYEHQQHPIPSYVAAKVLSNQSFSEIQARNEIRFLRKIQQEVEESNCDSIVRYFGDLQWQSHRVLLFEALSISLLDLMEYQRKFQRKLTGLPMYLIRTIVEQIVDALQLLSEMDPAIVHCDIKPENILISHDYDLKDLNCILHERPIDNVIPDCDDEEDLFKQSNDAGKSTTGEHMCNEHNVKVKLVDLGSACDSGICMHTYFQTRWYRAPEVILGLKYDCSIDVWSLACVVMEMFMGVPLFPGNSSLDMMHHFNHLLDEPPLWMLQAGTNVPELYDVNNKSNNSQKYRLKNSNDSTSHEVEQSENVPNTTNAENLENGNSMNLIGGNVTLNGQNNGIKHKQQSKFKRYFKEKNLKELIINWRYRPGPLQNNECFDAGAYEKFKRDDDQYLRHALHDFCVGLLKYDPDYRWTPWQVKNKHPFISSSNDLNIKDNRKLSGEHKTKLFPFVPEPDPAKKPYKQIFQKAFDKATSIVSEPATSRIPAPFSESTESHSLGVAVVNGNLYRGIHQNGNDTGTNAMNIGVQSASAGAYQNYYSSHPPTVAVPIPTPIQLSSSYSMYHHQQYGMSPPVRQMHPPPTFDYLSTGNYVAPGYMYHQYQHQQHQPLLPQNFNYQQLQYQNQQQRQRQQRRQ